MRTAILNLIAAGVVVAQTAIEVPSPAFAWRRVGNTVLDLGLASPAGGPIERTWFSADGRVLYARSQSGRTWQTDDLEHWSTAQSPREPVAEPVSPTATPESGARLAGAPLRRTRIYAAGRNLWKSDDGGGNWSNVTAFDGRSILGGALYDVAVSPANPDEVVVAGEHGVWRSVDGGESWAGLNEGLPNLPARRLLAVPESRPVIRIALRSGSEFLWRSGDRTGWRPSTDPAAAADQALLSAAASTLRLEVTAASLSGPHFYAGTADARLFVSSDLGTTWRPHAPLPGSGRILRFVTDPRDPLFALAITSSLQRARVLRTLNGGVTWDDITGTLEAGAVHGITADRLTGAVYLATAAGILMTYTDVVAASPPTPWTLLRAGTALDVMLDSAGNQLYAIVDGAGVFATLAPHRARDPRVVSAGDRILRAAAPGSLLSVLGTRIRSAQAGDRPAAVLAASESESQVQLPFDLNGSGVMVSLNSAAGRLQIGLPLAPASPAIFVDRDGLPLIMNADTGLMLDGSVPARSNMRIQILATGLGRVSPDWPIGLAAPLQEPPRVLAPVRAFLDREVLEVTRATLAPGYIGMYLVEVQLPAIVNRGTAELYVEAGSESSNRVRIYLEP